MKAKDNVATHLGRATGPDVWKQLVVTAEGAWVLLGQAFLTAVWADGPMGGFKRTSKFSGLIPSNQWMMKLSPEE